MKIAFRGGHNEQATGARGIIDELTEDRRVLAECINVAKEQGHEVLDCTPGPCDVNTDLVAGVNKANAWGADIYIPIHFDKAYSYYEGAIGTGTFVYSKNDSIKDEDIAQRISNNIAALGFKNRGVKEADYYDLRMTKMQAVLVEVCFCEATEDVALYRKLGPRKIAEAIVGGILNKNISVTNNQNNIEKVEYKMETIVLYTNPIDECGAKFLAYAVGAMAYDAKVPFNFDGGKVAKRIIAVGGDNPRKGEAGQFGFTGYITHKIADGDRFDTLDVCKDLAKRVSKGENIDSALNKYKINK
ncbi:hypothetical protein JCM1393_25570 [Clostridium carnis]